MKSPLSSFAFSGFNEQTRGRIVYLEDAYTRESICESFTTLHKNGDRLLEIPLPPDIQLKGNYMKSESLLVVTKNDEELLVCREGRLNTYDFEGELLAIEGSAFTGRALATHHNERRSIRFEVSVQDEPIFMYISRQQNFLALARNLKLFSRTPSQNLDLVVEGADPNLPEECKYALLVIGVALRSIFFPGDFSSGG